jgi:hypothetical protein
MNALTGNAQKREKERSLFVLFYDENALSYLLKTFFILSFVTIWNVPM